MTIFFFSSERGREGRLIRFLSDTRRLSTPRGVGIDQDTALIVTKDGKNKVTAEVVGSGGVFLADVGKSRAKGNK